MLQRQDKSITFVFLEKIVNFLFFRRKKKEKKEEAGDRLNIT